MPQIKTKIVMFIRLYNEFISDLFLDKELKLKHLAL